RRFSYRPMDCQVHPTASSARGGGRQAGRMLGTRRCAGCFAVKSPFPLADEWDGQGEWKGLGDPVGCYDRKQRRRQVDRKLAGAGRASQRG
ncbi:MAG TPA: hypothetical protein VHP11_17275, partial [Tepidisphaeraceae bacterium]|nr:hypothetical protein [Tepidisphaeraceae bacterium]